MHYSDDILKILLSALAGCLVGLEREIRRKPAGFRTLAIICLGSTIFTICSYKLGFPSNQDRIAANVITGVGFLGAGVIFRNGFSVSGITTAATIWISAALGMLIGIGEYRLTLIALIIALVILSLLEYLQEYIDGRFQRRSYIIRYPLTFDVNDIKRQFPQYNLKVVNLKETRQDALISFSFDVSGREKELDAFNQWLKQEAAISSFSW